MLMEEMKFLSTMTLVEETPEVTMTTETEMTTPSIRTLWTMISQTINGTSNDNLHLELKFKANSSMDGDNMDGGSVDGGMSMGSDFSDSLTELRAGGRNFFGSIW